MSFDELVATYGKLSRRLYYKVNKAEIECWYCESLWWGRSIYSHRRLRECQKLVDKVIFLAGKLLLIWKNMGVSLDKSGIPKTVLIEILDFVNPSFECSEIERLNKDFR